MIRSMNHAIRVLHLIETGGPGGAERMLLGMTRHLDPSFHSTVGLMKPGWLESQIQERGLDHVRIQGGTWGTSGVLATWHVSYEHRQSKLFMPMSFT